MLHASKPLNLRPLSVYTTFTPMHLSTCLHALHTTRFYTSTLVVLPSHAARSYTQTPTTCVSPLFAASGYTHSIRLPHYATRLYAHLSARPSCTLLTSTNSMPSCLTTLHGCSPQHECPSQHQQHTAFIFSGVSTTTHQRPLHIPSRNITCWHFTFPIMNLLLSLKVDVKSIFILSYGTGLRLRHRSRVMTRPYGHDRDLKPLHSSTAMV